MTTQPPIVETSERAPWWWAYDPRTGELTQHLFASRADAVAYRDAHGVAVWQPTLFAATLYEGAEDGD